MTKLDDGTIVANFTFHDVILADRDKIDVVIEPEPEAPARLVTHRKRVSKYLVKVVFGEAVNLPEPKEGVYLIVSAPVKIALPGRTDLVTPNDLVRDRDGKVIGCRTFAL